MASSFWSYLTGEVPNHLKLVGGALALGGAVFSVNYIRDLRAELKAQEQVSATLQQKFQTMGNSAMSGNAEAPKETVQQAAVTAFDPQVIATMKAQGDVIRSLTTSYASALASTKAVQPTVFAAGQQTPSGTLVNYDLDQNRGGLPSLTSLHLSYDPSKKDAASAFLGSKWTNNGETFTMSTGQWQKQKNGGMSTSVSLSRTVTRPDPNDPNKTIVVGVEPLAVTGSNTVYTPEGITAGVASPVPRWTASVGLSKDTAGTFSPFGSIDYRVTSRWGVFAGAVDHSLVGGASIRF